MSGTDRQKAVTAGLLALGSAAFAYGKRKADRQREQSRDDQSDPSGENWTEVPIRG